MAGAAGRVSLLITAQDATAAAFASVHRSLSGLDRSLAAVRAGLGAFGVALGAGALLDFTRTSLSAAAALGEMAERLGISVSRMQDYRAAAVTSGVSVDQLDTALGKFATRLGEAGEGVESSADGFDRLGIDIRDASGKVRSVDDVWRHFADRIKALETPAERAAAIASVLGEKAGPRLALLLGEGSAAFDEAGRSIDAWGARISEETIKAARAFDDFTGMASLTMKAWAATAAAEAPGLAERMFSPYLNYLSRLGQGMETLMRGAPVDRSGGMLPGGGPRPPIAGALPPEPAAEGRLSSANRRQLAEALAKAEEMAAADTLGAQQALNDQLLRQIAEREASHKAMLDAIAEGERMFADDVLGAQEALNDQQKRLAQEAQRVWDETRTPLENYNEQLDRLHLLMEQGAISTDTFHRAANKAREELNGVARASSEADDISRRLGMTFSSAFEDAIVRGQKLGDVIKGLAQDMLRLFSRKFITEPLFGAVFGGLGGLFGGSFALAGGGSGSVAGGISSFTGSAGTVAAGLGGFAEGGRPPVGIASVVGESGPELFMPDRPGTIIPNDAVGGVTVNQTIQISAGVAQTVRAEIIGMLPRIKAETVAAVADARQRGGRFAAAFA